MMLIFKCLKNHCQISTRNKFMLILAVYLQALYFHKVSARTTGSTDISSTWSSMCMPDELACDSGECIKVSKYCDGFVDCRDGSDENCETLKESPFCSPEDFRCDTLTCIRPSEVCDGKNDCPYGQDETVEACNLKTMSDIGELNKSMEIICNEDDFLCDNFFCISRNAVCDGKFDCLNGEDESPETCRHLQTTTSVLQTTWYMPSISSTLEEKVSKMTTSIPTLASSESATSRIYDYTISTSPTVEITSTASSSEKPESTSEIFSESTLASVITEGVITTVTTEKRVESTPQYSTTFSFTPTIPPLSESTSESTLSTMRTTSSQPHKESTFKLSSTAELEFFTPKLSSTSPPFEESTTKPTTTREVEFFETPSSEQPIPPYVATSAVQTSTLVPTEESTEKVLITTTTRATPYIPIPKRKKAKVQKVQRLECNKFEVTLEKGSIIVTCPPYLMWKDNSTECVPASKYMCPEAFETDRAVIRELYCPARFSDIEFPDLNEIYQYKYYKLQSIYPYPPHATVALRKENGVTANLYRNDKEDCRTLHKCVYSKTTGRLHHSEASFCPDDSVFNRNWIWCSNAKGIKNGYGSTVLGDRAKWLCNSKIVGYY